MQFRVCRPYERPAPFVRIATMSASRRLLTVLLLAGLPVLAAAQPTVAGPGIGERGGPPRSERPAPRGAGPAAHGVRPVSREREPVANAEARQSRRSVSEAVRWVQRSTGGQILGAELVPYEGRNITRVKYMDDRGRVRYMDDPGPGERSRRSSRRDDHSNRWTMGSRQLPATY